MEKIFTTNKQVDIANIFLEVRVDISFKTDFLFIYYNEFKEEKTIQLKGTNYSREFHYNDLSFDFNCMLFVYNKNFEENQVAQIRLFQYNRVIENKLFHLSNILPYDGWFILEKKVFTL